ncbi:MAG: nuclear transport factor 2 family protein [Novosphingobium sp.]
MSDTEARLAALEARVNELEDASAIRRLQNAYGYYIDYNRPEEVAGLFAKDGAVVFLSGEYRGHEGVMRLYGTWFQNLFTGGRRGPVHGLLLDHFQFQDVITVAPDRKTARGRFRGLLAGGWHDEVLKDKPEGPPQQFWEAGLYENDYVREANEAGELVWKIKRLNYMMQWQGDYESGWAHMPAHLQPASECYPANPIGPDVILPQEEWRPTWPNRQEVAMSFAHPVLGAAFAVEHFGKMQQKWP